LSGLSDLERLCDLLFEVSNEDRVQILRVLHEKPMRATILSKKLDLSIQVASRHIARLCDVGLARKDVEGYFSVTPFGELMLSLLQELSFLSKHREYFISHSLAGLPSEFLGRMGDLSESRYTTSIMDFLYKIESMIRESEKRVWLSVDQYPVAALSPIIEALGRGVEYKIIEQEDRVSGPDFILQAPRDVEAMSRARSTPLVEQRTMGRIGVIMYLSEKSCVLAFPNEEGNFDYRGFTTTDERALKWCHDLFQYNWKTAEPIVHISSTEYLRPRRLQPVMDETHRSFTVDGCDDSRVDAQMVQDAVDNYDEVILRGNFNFGASAVNVSRSVLIRGEGRKNDVPLTSIYKKGWAFPFTEFDAVFRIVGEDADVTIENIHFTDFNCSCIYGLIGRSLKIKNNVITLNTGYGRGWKYGRFGDVVTGIWLDAPTERLHEEKSFQGGVSIEENYLDFAFEASKAASVPFSMNPFIRNPEYRPNLINHEYYMGIGVNVLNMSGKVAIERNTVLNMNARGICATDNFANADVRIKQNMIKSDEYGSYPFSGNEAGAGILAQGSFMYQRPGFYVDIEDNNIQLIRPNFCGVRVLGSEMGGEDLGELFSGSVRNNQIHLVDGLSGIHINSTNFEVSGNKISGNAFYGVQTSGLRKSKGLDLKPADASAADNDVTELKIREPGLARVRRRRVTE
jgi:predicted transcriptional regulator